MSLKTVPERIKEIQTGYAWYCASEPDRELRPLFREDQMLLAGCPDACPKLVADFNRAGGLVLPSLLSHHKLNNGNWLSF